MKFLIERTSTYQKPIEDCILEEVKGFAKEQYVVEINSLEELVAFANKYGHIIVNWAGPDYLPDIEIYDSYRE